MSQTNVACSTSEAPILPGVTRRRAVAVRLAYLFVREAEEKPRFEVRPVAAGPKTFQDLLKERLWLAFHLGRRDVPAYGLRRPTLPDEYRHRMAYHPY